MADDPIDSGTVTQLITGWLARIEGTLNTIRTELQDKADKSEVNDIRRRVEQLEIENEHRSRSHSEQTEWKRWAIPLVITLALLAIGIMQLVK